MNNRIEWIWTADLRVELRGDIHQTTLTTTITVTYFFIIYPCVYGEDMKYKVERRLSLRYKDLVRLPVIKGQVEIIIIET